ncbi:MAG: radical SAM protein [Candidatus Coatesbacteria bacterium]|nr:radical SAM protein [Candidatus Coatesbacteria bacterium]
MKIALILPSTKILTKLHFLPIGLSYLAAIAQKKGFSVSVFFKKTWKEIAEELEANLDEFNLVGMQTFATNIEQCLSLACWIKERKPDMKIVFGGVHAANFPEDILFNYPVDMIIKGEGEIAFEHILEKISNGNPLTDIPNSIWKEENSLKLSSESSIMHNLDDLPYPAWEFFYREKPISTGHISTFRGCPYNCANCPSRTNEEGTVREYSVSRVIDEMSILSYKYGASSFEFYDETFGLNRSRTLDICKAICSSFKNISWSCYTRVRHVDKELLQSMKASGCKSIFYGVATTRKHLMDILRFHNDLAEVKQKIRLTRETGIKTTVSFLVGIPGEKFSDSVSTIKYGLSLDADRIVFQPCIPFPGSHLYETAKKCGKFIVDDLSKLEGWNKTFFIPQGRSASGINSTLFMAKSLSKIKTFLF